MDFSDTSITSKFYTYIHVQPMYKEMASHLEIVKFNKILAPSPSMFRTVPAQWKALSAILTLGTVNWKMVNDPGKRGGHDPVSRWLEVKCLCLMQRPMINNYWQTKILFPGWCKVQPTEFYF